MTGTSQGGRTSETGPHQVGGEAVGLYVSRTGTRKADPAEAEQRAQLERLNGMLPRSPKLARAYAALVDCLITSAGGPYLAYRLSGGFHGFVLDQAGVVVFAAELSGGLLAVSFLNHVVLGCLFRAGVGKLLFDRRVVLVPSGGRPGFWRSVLRWLTGMVVIWVAVTDGPDGAMNVTGELWRVRVVRGRDLRRARRERLLPQR